MGYVTMYIGLNSKLPNVKHHNYFEEYVNNIKVDPEILKRPYNNVLSSHNPACDPEADKVYFLFAPCPTILQKRLER